MHRRNAVALRALIVVVALTSSRTVHGHAADWAAGKPGSPIIGQDDSATESTTLVIPVRKWSDGSAAPPPT